MSVVQHLPYFCNAVIAYSSPPAGLELIFKNILQSYKISMGGQWEEYLGSYPPDLKESLIARFDL